MSLSLLRSFFKQPRLVGALAPSSPFLGRAITKYIPAESSVLEIGAGTGSLTMELIKSGLTDDRLFICEFDLDLCETLRSRFAGYPIFCADACDAPTFMQNRSVDVVVSGLPMRNFSKDFKNNLITGLRKVLKPKGCILQFTYGLASPIPFLRGVREEYILANFPPAFIWRYWLD